VFAAGEAHDQGLRHLAFPKSLDQGLGLWAPRDDGGAEQSLERKLAALRAALLNPMPYVGRLARKLRSDAIVLKPTIPRSIAKTSERDFWEERIAAAEEARLPLGEYWRGRRDSS